MYSTRLNKSRYNIVCLAVDKRVSRLVMCIDTGARYTCCSCNDLDENLSEADFKDCECKYLGGFIEGTAMKFYRYHTGQFTVGNIDLKSQDIWVTFDNRVSDAVLGMDMLRQITFLNIEQKDMLMLFRNVKELFDYIEES